MSNNIKDTIVAITGGAAGIGYEIADHFLKKGAKVTILLDINEKDGKEAVQTFESKYGKSKAVFYKCDVTKDLEDGSKIIFDAYESVDILVNNAGIADEIHVDRTIDINVTAVIEWSYKFLEHMSKSKGGRGGTIINMASRFGYLVNPFLPVYKASKFAVMGFTKSLGHKLIYDSTGVRVVALCPGFTITKQDKLKEGWTDRHEKQVKIEFTKYRNDVPWQKAEAVGRAAVDVFEKAESGTAWTVRGGDPAEQLP